MLVNSWQEEFFAGISSTLPRTFGLPRFHAEKFSLCNCLTHPPKNITSDMTRSLISRNSLLAARSSGSPPCRSAIIRMPSSSRSTSMSQLQSVKLRLRHRRYHTYRGLSGMTSEPAARIAPMTHWINSGMRHERSESMNEQK